MPPRPRSAPALSRFALPLRLTGIVAALLLAATAGPASRAQTTGAPAVKNGNVTGLPVPRFVSIKASPVNVRGGPSTNHQVAWVFVKKGVPVEVTAEFENWRRIRDVDGDRGWVFHTLIDGTRTVLVVGPDPEHPREGDLEALHYAPDSGSETVALVEPGVIGQLAQCGNGWCAVTVGGYEGFMRAEALYGVYPGEAG